MIDQHEPIMVHCGACGYERAIGYAPMPIDIFVSVGKLPCVSCKSKDVRMGPLPKETNAGDAFKWLHNGDTGTSSLTIWSVMTGCRPPQSHFSADVPHDPDDFGRCYRLLKVMPEWRERLPEVATKHKTWAPLVAAWDEMTALYEQELPSGRAPLLYKRMQELRKAS